MKAAALKFNTKLNSPDLELDPNIWTRKMGVIKYQDFIHMIHFCTIICLKFDTVSQFGKK